MGEQPIVHEPQLELESSVELLGRYLHNLALKELDARKTFLESIAAAKRISVEVPSISGIDSSKVETAAKNFLNSQGNARQTVLFFHSSQNDLVEVMMMASQEQLKRRDWSAHFQNGASCSFKMERDEGRYVIISDASVSDPTLVNEVNMLYASLTANKVFTRPIRFMTQVEADQWQELAPALNGMILEHKSGSALYQESLDGSGNVVLEWEPHPATLEGQPKNTCFLISVRDGDKTLGYLECQVTEYVDEFSVEPLINFRHGLSDLREIADFGHPASNSSDSTSLTTL